MTSLAGAQFIVNIERMGDLTAKQELFCQLTANGESHSDAYRAAYDCDPFRKGIARDACQLAGKPNVARRIFELQTAAAKGFAITRDWIIRWWFLRATYNPAEIMAWAVGACRHCWGDNFLRQWTTPEYLEAVALAERNDGPLPDIGGGFDYDFTAEPHADCPNCRGQGTGRHNIADTSGLSESGRAGFEGIKMTRDGIEVKMADRGQAMENLAKLLGFDTVQVRLMAEAIPTTPELQELARDPVALAAAYKSMMGGASVH